MKKDLTGTSINKWTITGPANKSTKYGSLWKASCFCGRERELIYSHLVRYKSCGCLKRQLQSEGNFKGCGQLPRRYWTDLLKKAELRGFKVEISIEQAWKLFKEQDGKCALSGEDIQFTKHNKKVVGTASLDRKDSSKGYALDNVQWVHKTLNAMKSDLDETDFRIWCVKVTQHNKLWYSQFNLSPS